MSYESIWLAQQYTDCADDKEFGLHVYKAAQAEAFEQAAKVCDAIADGWENNPGNNPLAGYVASHNCGYEIRQLGKWKS